MNNDQRKNKMFLNKNNFHSNQMLEKILNK